MSLSDYTSLKASITDWLHRSDVSASAGVVDDFIDMAEAEFGLTLRTRSMEAQTDIAMSGGYLNHPSDWVGWKRLVRMDGGRQVDLEPAPNEYLDVVGDGTSGVSKYYAVRGNRTYFNRTTNYTIRTLYYQAVPALSTSNTTNWLLTKFPQLYLAEAMKQAGIYLEDDALATKWGAIAEVAKQTLTIGSVRESHGGQSPVQRVGGVR